METNKIDHSIIKKYLEGKLSPREMFEFERQALDDPFLSDALDGYSGTNVVPGTQLSLLQRQLEERIAQQHENKSIFFFTWQRLSVAAAAGLMFIAAGILFWMKAENNRAAAPHQKSVEVSLTPVENLGFSRLSLKTQASVFAINGKDTAPQVDPVGGWNNYNNYLLKNLELRSKEMKGSVTLLFKVSNTAGLTDFRIEKGTNQLLNREAVRLIRKGPSWKSATGEGVYQVHLVIKFTK